MRGDGLNDVLVPAYGLAKDEHVPVGKHSSSLRLKLLGDLLAGADEMGAMVGTQVGNVRLNNLTVSECVARMMERAADVAVLRQGDFRVFATDDGAQKECVVGDQRGEGRRSRLLRLATNIYCSSDRFVESE